MELQRTDQAPEGQELGLFCFQLYPLHLARAWHVVSTQNILIKEMHKDGGRKRREWGRAGKPGSGIRIHNPGAASLEEFLALCMQLWS